MSNHHSNGNPPSDSPRTNSQHTKDGPSPKSTLDTPRITVNPNVTQPSSSTEKETTHTLARSFKTTPPTISPPQESLPSRSSLHSHSKESRNSGSPLNGYKLTSTCFSQLWTQVPQ